MRPSLDMDTSRRAAGFGFAKSANFRCGFVFFLLLLAAVPAIATEISLVQQGGVYMVPVRINNVLTLPFVLDSGASEVQIPADVAQRLLHAGTIRKEDFIAGRIYRLADGSQVKSERFMIRQIQIGDQVVENVTASIGSVQSAPLIGQSLLSRFPTWSLDNRRHRLILGNGPAAAPPAEAVAPAAEAPPPKSVNPFGTWSAAGPDKRDKKALRILCGQGGAGKLLDCEGIR